MCDSVVSVGYQRGANVKSKPKGTARVDPYYLVCKICKSGFFSKKVDAKTDTPKCRKALQRKRDLARAKHPTLPGL